MPHEQLALAILAVFNTGMLLIVNRRAGKAEKNTTAVSNGFAQKMRDNTGKTVEMLEELTDRFDAHLEDAKRDRRDLDELGREVARLDRNVKPRPWWSV